MKDLWERLEEYARAYLPWWQYRREGEEPEMALLTALGALLEGTAEELERLPEKHRREFLRPFAPDPPLVRPPLAWAALSAPRRERVPAGTEFYLVGDASRAWRTVEPTWAEDLRLVWQMFVAGKSGKLAAAPPPKPGAPTRLFDFRGPGVGRREIRFSHPCAFASHRGCKAALTLSAGDSKWPELLSGSAWFLEDGAERHPLAPPRRAGDRLVFSLPPAPEGQALLAQMAEEAPWVSESLGEVRVETCREGLPPDGVLTGDGFQEPGAFRPFGEEPEPWRTCCLNCADALGLNGGEVTLSWTAGLGSRERSLPAQEAPPLRAVMRRLPPPPPEAAEVYADAVAWEYWDGGGWKPIPGTGDLTGLFGALEQGHVRRQVTLLWPEDAQPCALQGQAGRWLRWRVGRAEGSERFPRRSHFPEVTGLTLSAAIRNAPVQVARRWGVEEDFSPVAGVQALFPALERPGNSWWLGFDPPPEGRLCLWLELDARRAGGELSAWEALPGGGSRPLKLRDDTRGLAHSGAVALEGIRGERTARFGRELWWLCLQDEAGTPAPATLTALACGATLLRGAGEDVCVPGESLRPLRGGAVFGATLSGAVGGSRRESDRRALERAERLRLHLGRGMSAGDVERLLQDRLDDVARARCVPGKQATEVGVLLREGPECPAAFALRQREIMDILERETLLPALGLPIRVREPRFYAVHLSAWLTPPEGMSPQEARRIVLETLETFLHPVTGGAEGRGWPLGALPGAEALGARLRSALPGVGLTGLLAVATGPDGTERETERIRDPFALPSSGVHTLWMGEEERPWRN